MSTFYCCVVGLSHCIVSHMSLQQGGTLVGRSWSDSLDCSRFPSEEDKFTIVRDESFQRSRVVMMVFLLVVRRVFYIGSRWIVEIVVVSLR